MSYYYRQTFARRHKDAICIGGAIAIVATLGFSGCGSRPEIVEQCESTSSRWVDANFSELETGIDFGGNYYSEWNYWSRRASDIYTVRTLNGEVHSKSHAFDAIDSGGYFRPPTPPHDTSIRRMRHFDDFGRKGSDNLKVHTRYDGESDYFNSAIAGTSKCTALIGEPIVVKTWYGMAYSTDWYEGTELAP